MTPPKSTQLFDLPESIASASVSNPVLRGLIDHVTMSAHFEREYNDDYDKYYDYANTPTHWEYAEDPGFPSPTN